jgi:hypothetical protein
MALDPAVLEARIDLRICELQVLAARTAVDWDAQALQRELAKRDSPLVRRLARAIIEASKTPLECKTDFERLAVEKEKQKVLECAAQFRRVNLGKTLPK